jgi:hypothetical protein
VRPNFKAVLNLAAVLSLVSTSGLAANISLPHWITTLRTPFQLLRKKGFNREHAGARPAARPSEASAG